MELVLLILKTAVIIDNHVFYHALPFVVLMHKLSLLKSVIPEFNVRDFIFSAKLLT